MISASGAEGLDCVLTPSEARALTDEVKLDAERLWAKLVELYEGAAHLALGYLSWGAYYEAEFGRSSDYGYKLLRAGQVLDELRVDNCLLPPANEAQARELAPLLDKPDELRSAWAEVIERHPEPTAVDVREVVSGRMGVHYSSETDLWSTPQELFDLLDAEFLFTLDVCATIGNAKCSAYFTESDNGLEQEWVGTCWMNPPYGRAIGDWMRKAHQSARDGATVVCLVPARTDTNWWWDFARNGEVRFLRGRLQFGDADSGAPFPSAVVVFGRPADVVWWEKWQKV